MSDYYFSLPLGNQRSLCISPLTREELDADKVLRGNGAGYYLYERDEADDGLTVLARIVSTDAAVKLYESLHDLAGTKPTAPGSLPSQSAPQGIEKTISARPEFGGKSVPNPYRIRL